MIDIRETKKIIHELYNSLMKRDKTKAILDYYRCFVASL